MLAGKGSSGPDRFYVFCDQALHFNDRTAIMDAQEITAGLKSLGEVGLILVFGILLLNLDAGYDLGTEVVKDGPRPYFLNDVLILFGMKRLEAERVLKVAEGIFLVPPQVVQILEILKVELALRQIRNDVLKAAGPYLEAHYPEGDIIFAEIPLDVIHGDRLAYVTVLIGKLRA